MNYFQGFQSITGLYNEHREPIAPCEARTEYSTDEIKKLQKFMEEVHEKQTQLAQENIILKEDMKKMRSKIDELEVKLR